MYSRYILRYKKAILYGSRAMGNNRPASDIDLTLVAPGWTLTELFRLETELDDLLLPYTIDLSLLHRIDNAELRAHIDRVGVTFYASDQSTTTSTELH